MLSIVRVWEIPTDIYKQREKPLLANEPNSRFYHLREIIH